MKEYFLLVRNFFHGLQKSLINILFISVHPIIFILALVSFITKFKIYFRKPLYRFIIIYSFIIITVCSVKLTKQGFLSDRYFLILTAIFCILAAEGLLITAEYINLKIISKYCKKISYKNLTVILLVIILITMAVKPFTSFNKKIFRELRAISTTSNFTQRPVLITNDSDQRYAYYFGSTFYAINLDQLTVLEDPLCKQWNHQFDIPQYQFSINPKDFYKEIHKLGNNVFILIQGKTPEEIEKQFKKQGLEFNFKPVRTFKDRKGKPLSLLKLK